MSQEPFYSPPKLAVWLLSLFCRKDYQDEVMGDFMEIYTWRVGTVGPGKARLWSLIDAFSAIRLVSMQNNTMVKFNFSAMISLKVTLRSFKRNKFQHATNIFGLACGFMVFMAIFQYVYYEKHYEAFNPEAEQIFRVNNTLLRDSTIVFQTAESSSAIATGAAAYVPQVLASAKLHHAAGTNSCVITLGHDPASSFIEEKIYFATEEFPGLFALQFLEGTAEHALDQPFEVIISRSLAEKYFQGASALGKMLILDDDEENHEVLTVSGVFEDYPGNSHLEFDMLVSFKTLFTREGGGGYTARQLHDEIWEGRHDYLTYLKLAPNTVHRDVTAILEAKSNAQVSYPGYHYAYDLMPLAAIHTSPELRGEVKSHSDLSKLNTLLLLGGFVLLLAWVNFINLTTATAMNRAKESGMRKILGGTRKQLVWQFLFESVFTGLLSFVLGVILFGLSFPYVNDFLPVSEKWYIWQELAPAATILAIVLVSGIAAGVYPALVLSGFKPVAVLKGTFSTSRSGLMVRKTLVVLQAGISIFLITGLSGIVKQVDFMIHNDLGMEPEQVMVIRKPGNLYMQQEETEDVKSLFKTRLADKSFVKSYAVTDALPGNRLRKGADINLTEVEDNEVESRVIYVEYDYLSVLNIPLVAGRDFRNTQVDEKGVILNESAIAALGLTSPEEAISKRLYEGNEWVTIIGVIADYHHTSLKNKVVPMMVRTRNRGLDYYLIKLEGGTNEANLAEMEEVFSTVFPGNPFEYFFLDNHFVTNYEQEQRFGESFGFFALIAILIAAIGLYSLSSFVTMSRSKEIGVRKVLGAGAMTIVNHLNRDFVILILLASLIATPLSLWALEDWLTAFPYRISLGLLFFVGPGLVVLFVSLLSVSIKTIAASRINPVNLLRAE
jgi:putative ABC transport system permease protein